MTSTIETADELKEYISTVFDSLSQIRGGFQSSITSNTDVQLNSLQTANVASPIDEIPKLSSLISAHATKLGLVFKPPIATTSYNACRKEVDSLTTCIMLLISLIYQIKKDSGIYSNLFSNELAYDALSVVERCIILLNNLKELVDMTESESDNPAEKETDQRLSSVGLVWDRCEKITKTCKSGSSGVLKSKLKQTNKLVVDAWEELKDWLEDPILGGDFDFDDDDILGLNSEKKVVEKENDDNVAEKEQADGKVIEVGKKWSTKIQMIKLLISLLDKSIPASKYNTKFSKSLDFFNDCCLKINEHVDDVVACIVYDSDLEACESAGEALNKEANNILELVRKINNNDEKKCKWLDSWKAKYSE